jgi:hypothetical protein
MATTNVFPSSSASSHPHTQPQTPTQHQPTTSAQNSSDSGAGAGGAGEDDASSAFKAAIFQRLHPRVYLERFLAEDVRPDGRSLGTVHQEIETRGSSVGNESKIWRDVSINVGMSPFAFDFFDFPVYFLRLWYSNI